MCSPCEQYLKSSCVEKNFTLSLSMFDQRAVSGRVGVWRSFESVWEAERGSNPGSVTERKGYSDTPPTYSSICCSTWLYRPPDSSALLFEMEFCFLVSRLRLASPRLGVMSVMRDHSRFFDTMTACSLVSRVSGLIKDGRRLWSWQKDNHTSPISQLIFSSVMSRVREELCYALFVIQKNFITSHSSLFPKDSFGS